MKSNLAHVPAWQGAWNRLFGDAMGWAGYYTDRAYGFLAHGTPLRRGLFWSGGWGDLSWADFHMHAQEMQQWPPKPIHMDIVEDTGPNRAALALAWKHKLMHGRFHTPCGDPIRQVLPPESHVGKMALVLPRNKQVGDKIPCVLHLSGTGDQRFGRRLRLSAPLADMGIASVILENPLYGDRRPHRQKGAKLTYVSDLLALGKATIDESRSILHWLDQQGFGPLAVCGLSMGGVHAAMVASSYAKPIACVPLLAPHSASAAFCSTGVLRDACDWRKLDMDEEVALQRLRELLDTFANVLALPCPPKPSAAIFVAAKHDAYVPIRSSMMLHEAWPGSELRWVSGGHVSSYLFQGHRFRQAILDAMDRV
eukprot:scaffold492_cov341-Pavlova_lutheri.AAC.21